MVHGEAFLHRRFACSAFLKAHLSRSLSTSHRSLWRYPVGPSYSRLRSYRASSRTNVDPCGDHDGDDAAPRRRRGRPPKSQQPGEVNARLQYPTPGTPAAAGESGPQTDGDMAACGHDQQQEHQPEPQKRRRRGRPRKLTDNASRADAPTSSSHSSSTTTTTTTTSACSPSSSSLSQVPSPRSGSGARTAVAPATATAASVALSHLSTRRRRGRPSLSSLAAAGSPAVPAGASPCRDMELRLLLLRQLDLRPDELRPAPGSWRKLMASITPAALDNRVSELREVLGLEAVRHIARRCPHVLQLTTDRILSRLADLNLRLGLPRHQLVEAVCRFPALLGVTSEAVGSRVALLVQHLGKSEDFVLSMVVSQPVLLCLSRATLSYRIGLLHEAGSMLPRTWGVELTSAAPSSLGRLLRCSDSVLSRLTWTYLRTANNGRKFHRIRSMATICCQPAARWHRENPLFRDWLEGGERDRREGKLTPWPGWWRGTPPAEVDWWEGASGQLTSQSVSEGDGAVQEDTAG